MRSYFHGRVKRASIATSPPLEIPLNDHDSLHELRERLRELGLRATSARLAVLKELHAQARPMTHEELMARLESGGFDGATIYRILADLADIGLLQRMDLGDKIWRFELNDHCREIQHDHAHFLCDSCGDITCLPALEVRAKEGLLPEALRGAELHLRLSGRCSKCTGAGSAPAPDRLE